ncbi:MAG: putative metal-binding motif-containing protein [Deltaproteobacteria bacterium]|nr:putative metal-binding motif-containing protein [Deltaproteobacteria bacterium]
MRALLRLFGAATLVSISVLTASACQVALRADDEDPRCAPDKIRCAPGLTCQGGFCRPCVPKPEECNLEDDDCDGEVDEDFDQDGDGFKQCGATGQIDCNDDPKKGGRNVFPGAAELCNGYDDNCDGRTDEEPNDCTAEQECWSAKGVCTIKGDCRLRGCESGGCNPETGQCSEPDCRISLKCAVGEVCDSKSGVCVKITDVGEPCDSTSVCRAGSTCFDLSLAGITARAPQICTRACCESSTCPEGFVCKEGTTGASLCVRAVDVGLSVGTKAAYEKCAGGGECRSGVCQSGACIDTCCGVPACGAGGTCSLASDGRFACRAATGSATPGGACDDSSECQSGFCYGTDSWFGGACSKHCCSSEDCPSGWRCSEFTSGTSAIVSACARMSIFDAVGTKRPGEACTSAGQCRSGRCTDGICSDSCCRDSDCAGGTVCLPIKVYEGKVAKRCVKK